MIHCKKIILLSFLSCFTIAFFIQAAYTSENNSETTTTFYSDTIIGGYLPYYRINKVTPEIFDYLTHLYYFSLGPNIAGELGRINSTGDFTHLDDIPAVQKNIDTLISWRDSKPVKIYLVVGGWVQSNYFDEAVANPVSRANLVANIKSFCLDYGVDGVDLDWEPYNGPVNDTHYGLLISELRTAFDGTDLEISSAINPNHTSMVEEYADADFIQLMSYGSHFSGNTQVSMATLENWVNGWVNNGFSKSKLVIGLPAYGKTPSDNSAIIYRDIVNLYSPQADTDMITHNNKTYYFNNINTIKEKTQYMLDNELKGVMMWELGQDTTVNDPKSLLWNIHETIYNPGAVATPEFIATANTLKLYPNPTCDNIYIETEVDTEKVQLINFTGQVILEQIIRDNKTEINTSDIKSGIYFVKVFSINNITTRKLVIE